MNKCYKFKKGDKVERTENFSSEMPLGSCWVVVGYNDDGWLNLEGSVDGCGYYCGWGQENFRLISENEAVVEHGAKYDPDKLEPIVSDGGSSDYYFTTLPKHLIDQIVKTGGIEIKDIARYVYDNNADAFNIIKAQKRIIEANKGVGKAGITKLYDAKKIVYFANEQLKAIKREGTNE
jgi:hypothetical protein